LSKNVDNNSIIISHHCATEKTCFVNLKKYWDNQNFITEENYLDFKNKITEKKENKYLLCSIKPNIDVSLFQKNIIFVCSIEIIKKFVGEKNKQNKNKLSYSLDNLGKKYLTANYKEKHRSLFDCEDLILIFKKIFEKNNFFDYLKNFLKKSERGIFFFNEKNNNIN